jgi:hypothetical protein
VQNGVKSEGAARSHLPEQCMYDSLTGRVSLRFSFAAREARDLEPVMPRQRLLASVDYSR